MVLKRHASRVIDTNRDGFNFIRGLKRPTLIRVGVVQRPIRLEMREYLHERNG